MFLIVLRVVKKLKLLFWLYLQQLRDLDSRQTVIVEDQQITDLNSIAAKRVFDVGYSQKHIEEAIRHVRQNIGIFYLRFIFLFNLFISTDLTWNNAV